MSYDQVVVNRDGWISFYKSDKHDTSGKECLYALYVIVTFQSSGDTRHCH